MAPGTGTPAPPQPWARAAPSAPLCSTSAACPAPCREGNAIRHSAVQMQAQAAHEEAEKGNMNAEGDVQQTLK